MMCHTTLWALVCPHPIVEKCAPLGDSSPLMQLGGGWLTVHCGTENLRMVLWKASSPAPPYIPSQRMVL
eukprot:10971683-Karenia_brevis.AAC.1